MTSMVLPKVHDASQVVSMIKLKPLRTAKTAEMTPKQELNDVLGSDLGN